MRRAGVEKLGYFPIPAPMIQWIAAQFTMPTGKTVTVIDPCMGEGAALKLLVDSWRASDTKVMPFGCEISQARHRQAAATVLGEKRDGISRLLHGPAEFIDTSSGTFACLYLNPPFDERGKEQNRWLELTRDWLTPDGWLVFVTTEESALRPDTQELLDRCYDRVTCYRYPDVHRQYHEVVIFARRRAIDAPYHQRHGVLYTATSLTTLTLEERFSFALPAAEPPKRFSLVIPDIEEGITALRSVGLSMGEAWKRATHAASLQSHWQPLLELSDGHIANLISSGVFDGLAIHDSELGRCLITGYSSKARGKPVVEMSEDGLTQTTTVSEIPVVHLVVMNIDSGEVHQFSSRDPEHMERFILRHIDTLKRAITETLRPVFDVDTMLADYLPYVPNFKAPGILPGATRIRTKDCAKLRVMQTSATGYMAVDEQGETQAVAKAEVAHVYQNMLPAQVIKASAMAYALRHKTTSVIEVGAMGTGKTSTSSLTLYLYLAKWIARTQADSQRKVKIVVVCPGHLVNKWAREAGTNFSQITVGGRAVQVVIPGRLPHRQTAYQVIGQQVICAECGTPTSVKLSAEEKLKGTSLTDKLNRLKSLKCSNPKCGNTLIETIADCPIADIDAAFAAPGMTVVILSKENAKLGASWEAAFVRRTVNTRQPETRQIIAEERIQCPHCGGYVKTKKGDYLHPDDAQGKRLFCKNTIERPKRENGKVVMTTQTVYEVRGTQYSTHTLPDGIEPPHRVKLERLVPVMEKVPCGTPLFTFTRLGNVTKKSKAASKPANRFGLWVSGTRHPNHGSARWELAKVISRQHRGQYLLIVDECHQYKSATSVQGKAIQWLITSAQRTIALTGTVFGGKASSLFYLLYRLSPQFREAFSWHSVEYFIDQFGVRDYITKVSAVEEGERTTYGAHTKETTRIEEGNGVDPSIVRWLLSIGVFLTLDDLGIALPEKEERFHWIEPEPTLGAGLYCLEEVQKEASMLAAKGDMSMFSAWMQAALGWPLCPDQPELYLHPDHRKVAEKMREDGQIAEAEDYEAAHTKRWAEAVPFTEERPEGEIVRQISDACAQGWHELGDRAVVYVSGVKRPANKHLYQAMKRRGLKPFILTTPGDGEVSKWCATADFAKCELEQRETVIAEALADKDINVLIVNPPLVATGLDLVAFNRLHFCGLPTYSVYTFEQSMCRLHRPGQQKKVTIDFWVYGTDPTLGNLNNQLQALGMAVMSDKVRASAVVSGSVGAGLAALNQSGSDIMTTLRDLLLNESVETLPAFNAASHSTTSPRRTDARYAWIEAEIECYDDLRKPLVTLGAAPMSAQLIAEKPQPLAEVAPVQSIAPEPLPLLAELNTVATADQAITTPTLLAAEETEADADPVPNLLAALALTSGATVTVFPNDPFALPAKAATSTSAAPKRKCRPHFLDAPEVAPADGTTPQLPLPTLMPPRVKTGRQLELLLL